jgi:mannose-binding lectin 2
MSAFFTFIVALAVTCCLIFANKLDISFEPPFTEVDWSGNKIVGINWKNFGSTVVNTNFIRLTPDRQSKKGALWSRGPLGVPSLSAILKFRIAGQGKNFFGDGLAMWIVSDSDYIDGDLHGYTEQFYGIGTVDLMQS